MGCACLCGHGHHWPAGGAGCVAAGRRQQAGLAHQPDAAGPDARSQLLRPGGDADAVRISDREEQPDAEPDPNAIPHAIGLAKPIGDRDRRRFPDTMPIAVRDGDAITVAQRQRETFRLALVPA
jgi:hypothetical protein